VFAGSSETIDLELSGASTGKLTDLDAAAATVALSGASSAQIAASQSVTGALSGASHLQVRGNPAERDLAISGGSSADYE
jgi:hypothetical protein